MFSHPSLCSHPDHKICWCMVKIFQNFWRSAECGETVICSFKTVHHQGGGTVLLRFWIGSKRFVLLVKIVNFVEKNCSWVKSHAHTYSQSAQYMALYETATSHVLKCIIWIMISLSHPLNIEGQGKFEVEGRPQKSNFLKGCMKINIGISCAQTKKIISVLYMCKIIIAHLILWKSKTNNNLLFFILFFFSWHFIICCKIMKRKFSYTQKYLIWYHKLRNFYNLLGNVEWYWSEAIDWNILFTVLHIYRCLQLLFITHNLQSSKQSVKVSFL